MPNMNDILRQAQLMQRKISKIQEELAEKEFEATSGGGMVKAVVTGTQTLKSIKIEPKAAEDVEMLQDLVIAAVNEALRISHETMEREMGAISGNIKLPNIF
ncbi:MAG: YbaB/EbfC family nucleoid-associated protein [Desulfovibrionaceae bacterium]|nr:YbaB/EbfC family nucleoid-associated protein [Desulfovibrionaceae bacterium]